MFGIYSTVVSTNDFNLMSLDNDDPMETQTVNRKTLFINIKCSLFIYYMHLVVQNNFT